MDLEQVIIIQKLKKISTDGGQVLHALKSSENVFKKFGEVYFSSVEKNIVRAWKLHTEMTLNLIVPIGMVKFVFYNDDKKNFFMYKIGVDNYCRLTVPPNIWFGFQGLNENLIMNLIDMEHNPDEVKRKSTNELYYDWL